MRTFVFMSVIILTSFTLFAQSIPLNHYGLPVVNDAGLYQQLSAADSNQVMVDLEEFIPGIEKKIYYATPNNFTHQVLYPEARIFLRLPAAEKLKAVEKDLQKEGLGLLIFDAYRPYAITEKMWEIEPDDRYAADPRHGSGHNRGASVDLS